MNLKRTIALILTTVCLLGLLSGCRESEPDIQWVAGSAADGIYTNSGMNLTFYMPDGWTDVTAETHGADPEGGVSYPLPDGNDLWVRCEKTDTGIHTVFHAPEGVTVYIS